MCEGFEFSHHAEKRGQIRSGQKGEQQQQRNPQSKADRKVIISVYSLHAQQVRTIVQVHYMKVSNKVRGDYSIVQ